MTPIRITCAILCYNYGRFLTGAIDSCLNQAVGDHSVEILVIDDGSTDDTPAVCLRYADRIRVSRTPNQGFPASLTRAIREASGEYICLLDADDYFAPDKLSILAPHLRAGCVYIEHACQFIAEDGRLLAGRIALAGNTSCLCVRREQALDLLPAQNEIFFHALKKTCRSVSLSNPLTYYRVHAGMARSKPQSAWYQYLVDVTLALADHLAALSLRPPAWTTPQALLRAEHEFRCLGSFHAIQSALHGGHRIRAIGKIIPFIAHAIMGTRRVTLWHLKWAVRAVINYPLDV